MGTICAFTGYRREKMPFVENNEDAKYTSFRVMLTKVIARLIERGVDPSTAEVTMLSKRNFNS